MPNILQEITDSDQLTQFVREHRANDDSSIDPFTDRSQRCIHLGEDTGTTRECGSCTGRVQLKVLNCGVHGKCTISKSQDGLACCATCRQYTPPAPPPPHYNIALAAQYASSLPLQPPSNLYNGRGVVICGGGKYWPSIYVTAKLLRLVGCDLPTQVWYLGEREYDRVASFVLDKLNVQLVDITTHPDAKLYRNVSQEWPGSPAYQVKSFAALHSPFNDVLLLDADSYPCVNPEVIFDDYRYKMTGGLFYPDLPGTNVWTKWKDWGVEKFGPDCGWEVGQYAISKSTAWRQLNLARWYDDHGDWCYGGSQHHDHGDKGPHRIAWAQYRTEPAFFTTRCLWHKVAFVHPGPDGHTPMFIHRCRSKFTINQNVHFPTTPQNGCNLHAGLPMEKEAFEALREFGEYYK